MTPLKYEHRIDLDADNAHRRVLHLVGAGKRVLELGCASGYMSQVLVERFGCTVVGIECDPEAAERARAACGRVIVADIDALDFAAALGAERFDVIVCADVLEHLRDPGRALAALRPLLAPDGYVVASLPNVGHVAIVAELLNGRFPYGPLGLLDDTHLRFFTRQSVYECFERAGFLVSHLECLRVEPEATEFRADLSRFPPEVATAMRRHEDSTTYQFILTASPASGGAAAGLRDGLERALDATDSPIVGTGTAHGAEVARAFVEALLGRMTFLEAERNGKTRELDETRVDLRLHAERVSFLEGEVARQVEWVNRTAERLDVLEGQLAEIEGSVGWRVVKRVRRWRARLAPPGSRRDHAVRVVRDALFGRPKR
ncbi:MAG TPA: class I SAM-dependent methyltransferase [Candidatus Acidoferrum sp.]|nr:class I SAM-dependent methyltransferase [Candidatus Acidoferrum sp.]